MPLEEMPRSVLLAEQRRSRLVCCDIRGITSPRRRGSDGRGDAEGTSVVPGHVGLGFSHLVLTSPSRSPIGAASGPRSAG